MPGAPQVRLSAFVTKSRGLLSALRNDVMVSAYYDPTKQPSSLPHCSYTATWDTGATNSVITNKVVTDCCLAPLGRTTVYHAQGSGEVSTYIVNMVLPSQVGFVGVVVTEGQLSDGVDVLIGMDIISKGDFAVTNRDGQTWFTFQTPATHRIDFVDEINQANSRSAPKAGRNQPCPCGSGKKYKQCCGRYA